MWPSFLHFFFLSRVWLELLIYVPWAMCSWVLDIRPTRSQVKGEMHTDPVALLIAWCHLENVTRRYTRMYDMAWPRCFIHRTPYTAYRSIFIRTIDPNNFLWMLFRKKEKYIHVTNSSMNGKRKGIKIWFHICVGDWPISYICIRISQI